MEASQARSARSGYTPLAAASRAITSPPRRDVPRHVAIIMDGNRRWARNHGLSARDGYRAGALTLREIVQAAIRAGIEVLTTNIFAEKYHRRDEDDLRALMELIALFAREEREKLPRENVRVRIIGRTDRLPPNVRAALEGLVEATAACDGFLLALAVDYSARAELCDAVRALTRDVACGKIKAADVNEKTLTAYLHTADLPDLDLLIRTGGELKLSNFLLYQAAYSELWATPRKWPDFNAALLNEALADFAKRQRRFGS